MPMNGFKKLKAIRECDPRVMRTAVNTHTRLRPVLSMTMPMTGDTTADTMYGNLTEKTKCLKT